MTERRVEVPMRYSAERINQRLYGAPELTDKLRVEYPANPEAVGTPAIHFRAFCRLDGEEGTYTVYDEPTHGEGFVIDFPARAPGALRAIPAVSVHTDEPEDTSVGWRVVLDGTEAWWSGASWDAPADDELHWNTASDLATNLGAVDMSAARLGLGFRATLRTTRSDRTPKVYGVRIFAAVAPTATQLDPTMQADPRDELAAVVAAAIKGLQVDETEELAGSALGDGNTTIDYSEGIGGRRRNVTDVVAVYDLDADPAMMSPLAGAWDGGTKIYTLDAAVDASAKIHVKLQWAPWAQMAGGDADFLIVDKERGPMALIEVVGPGMASRQRGNRHAIYRPDNTVRTLRAPMLEDVQVEARLLGEYDSDVRALQRAIVTWARDADGAGTGQGRVLTLPSTDHRQAIRLLPLPAVVARRGDMWQTTHRLMADKLPVFVAQGVEQQGVTEIPVAT